MFVTSASEVAAPRISNLLLASFDEFLDPAEVLRTEPVVSRQLDLRLNPKFGLPVSRLHVDVKTVLLAREEEEPEGAFAEDRGGSSPGS